MSRSKKARQRLYEQALKNVPRRHSLSRGGYLRVNTKYPIHFVLSHVGPWRLKLAGYEVKMNSKRYQNFLTHGIICALCGIRGRYFRLERHGLHANCDNNTWHFNLYAVDADGDEVLMTKDHIIPKSAGGSDDVDNLQPMCHKCNGKKADNIM